MKSSAILFLLLCTCVSGNSQDKVFKTYQDYLNNAGVEIEEFVWAPETYNKVKVVFTKPGGGKVRYKAKQIWGFTYKGHLFRSTGRQFGMLYDTGKVCYYINAVAALSMLRNNSNEGVYMVNWSEYLLSVGGMGGKLYGMPAHNGLQKDFPALKKEHPELQELFDCLKRKWEEQAQKCVQDYNSSH